MNINDNDATRLNLTDNDSTQIISDSDATRIGTTDSDSTRISDNIEKKDATPKQAATPAPAPKAGAKKTEKKDMKNMAAFAGAGVLLGSVSAVFVDMHAAEPTDSAAVESSEPEIDPSSGAVEMTATVEELPAALTDSGVVNDDMSFDEAFSTARAELGPGSVFQWQGNVYATYTKGEWETMSDDQKSDFYDDLELSNPYKDSADAEHVDQNTPIQEPVESPVDETEVTEQPETEAEPEVESDPVVEVEPEPAIESEPEVEVEPAVEHQPEIEVVPEVELEPVVEAEAVVETAVDPLVVALDEEDIEVVHIDNSDNVASGDMEVEILGVVQDPTTGYNIGTMTVDGQDVYVIDVDGDMVFDGMAMDFNNDGVIDNDEIIDISDDGLTVADLGGLEGQTDTFNSTPDTDMLGSNSGPDYMSEMMS